MILALLVVFYGVGLILAARCLNTPWEIPAMRVTSRTIAAPSRGHALNDHGRLVVWHITASSEREAAEVVSGSSYFGSPSNRVLPSVRERVWR